MNKKPLLVAIISCWVILLLCFIVKLFGGEYFNILIVNERAIAIGNYIDTNLWLQNIIAFITSLLSISLINLAVLKQKLFTLKQFIIVLVVTLIVLGVKIVGDYIPLFTIIGAVLDIIPYGILPLCLPKNIKRSIVGLVLYLLFQVVSIAVKGLSFVNINDENTLVALIFSIDVYIMLALFYMHSMYNKSNKKGE